MTVYGLETEIKFGKKHRGETIEDIIENDPDYLLWALDTIEWFELDDEAEKELETASGHSDDASTGATK